MGDVLQRLGLNERHQVFELSHHGALFQFLEKRLGSRLTSSEFLGEGTSGMVINGIRSEDVQDLTFEDELFDFVTSTEVFEHVPDDLAGMREVARVLKPGGAFVFTVPLYPHMATLIRARVRDGRLEHLLPPEFHGDPLQGDGGVLVFREYGADVMAHFAVTGLVGTVEPIEDPASAGPALPVCVLRKPLL